MYFEPGTKCHKIPQNTTKCHKMPQNATKKNHTPYPALSDDHILFLSSDPKGEGKERDFQKNLSQAEMRPSGFIRIFDPFRSEAEKKHSGMRPETDEEEREPREREIVTNDEDEIQDKDYNHSFE